VRAVSLLAIVLSLIKAVRRAIKAAGEPIMVDTRAKSLITRVDSCDCELPHFVLIKIGARKLEVDDTSRSA
jgi:hypothetical protein